MLERRTRAGGASAGGEGLSCQFLPQDQRRWAKQAHGAQPSPAPPWPASRSSYPTTQSQARNLASGYSWLWRISGWPGPVRCCPSPGPFPLELAGLPLRAQVKGLTRQGRRRPPAGATGSAPPSCLTAREQLKLADQQLAAPAVPLAASAFDYLLLLPARAMIPAEIDQISTVPRIHPRSSAETSRRFAARAALEGCVRLCWPADPQGAHASGSGGAHDPDPAPSVREERAAWNCPLLNHEAIHCQSCRPWIAVGLHRGCWDSPTPRPAGDSATLDDPLRQSLGPGASLRGSATPNQQRLDLPSPCWKSECPQRR